MGKSFDAFRKILREQNLDAYFRDSCFGQYLDLSEDNNARFRMKMVIDLLKRRFMYENKDKMDEVWAFKAIPYLRQQVNYQKEVFYPRFLRWLSAKTDKNVKFLDLFNPPKDAIVHPSLVSTNRELKMPFFLLYVNGGSSDGAVGGGSDAAFRANDAPLIVFKTNHYEYDHTSYTYFAPPSEWSAYKC
ncbi:putative glycerol-3-phosphate 2-O-acyltransferase 6-like [Capsicum annuum]|nr:putative glycerol-3-phosphate 2-O-acyltransferase 6-like [Capsicum annuum]